MTPYEIYPNLPGLSYSVTKEPSFKTQIQKAVSGRELRLTYQPIPRWLFTLKYEFLRDGNGQGLSSSYPGVGFTELKQLLGFFLYAQGSLTAFAFDDPTDDNVTRQQIGVGNGITTIFQLVRTLGKFTEPILAPNVVENVYINQVVQPSNGYSVNFFNGLVTFVSAPATGLPIEVDFTYYFLCRFEEDSLSFENFMQSLWSQDGVKLRSVLL